MSTGTTLVEELEREARSCESRGTYYTTSPTARVDFMARAARLRQRAAWVRKMGAQPANPDADAVEMFRALTGPGIPAKTAPTERKEP